MCDERWADVAEDYEEELQIQQDNLLGIMVDLTLTESDLNEMKIAVMQKYVNSNYDFLETLYALSALNDYVIPVDLAINVFE